MAHIFIGAGSNLEDRENHLAEAKRLLEYTRYFNFLRTSPVYETEPVGGPPQGKYLNAVWEAETYLYPYETLREFLAVESAFGRIRAEKNGPRTLDLDLLFYDDRIIHEPGLDVPHPRLHERFFVLKPLSDIAPDWKHPELGKTACELLAAVSHAELPVAGPLRAGSAGALTA